MSVDAVKLTADLVRCASVTPVEGGALGLHDELLSAISMEMQRFDSVDNHCTAVVQSSAMVRYRRY